MITNELTKTYGDRMVLRMNPLELAEGGVTVLVGANGSGKTTFAKILAGVLTADGKRNPFPEPVRVGYLPQHAFAFRMSTERNLRIVSGDRETEEKRIRQFGLGKLRKTGAKHLSGGETARMALARLLMKPFDLLILDEPTAAMDMESTAAAEEAVREYIAETGCACLLITHSIRQAARLGDRLVFLKDGRAVETGACGTCLAHPGTPELKTFLDFYG